MTFADAKQRFSNRVADYARYRPSYPCGVVQLLREECGLRPKHTIADIGSGTGLLSKLFLDHGNPVFGAEPNPEMRAAGEAFLQQYANFRSVSGSAEATTLSARSVEFITAGQAFHWFDRERAWKEFARILKPRGWVALVWNERLSSPGFNAGYEDLVTRYGPEHPHAEPSEMDHFFGEDGWRLAQFPNQQVFDREGLRGRFLSSSYAPLPGAENYPPSMQGLDRLFDEFQRDGRVTLLYTTEVYIGRLAQAEA